MGDALEDNLVASWEDFAAVDWSAAVASTRKVDPRDLADIFRRLLPTDGGDERKAAEGRACRLLFELCGIALRPLDRGAVWGPSVTINGEGRSAIPEDFAQAQWAVIAQLAPTVRNPGLQARLADLVWSCDRRARSMADLAVDAYCEMVEGQLDGRFDPYLKCDSRVDFDAINYSLRALQVSTATQKGKWPSERPKALAIKLYEFAKADCDFVVFTEAARVALRFGLLDPATVGADAELVGASPVPEGRDMAVQSVWQFAAEAYRHAKQPDAERRCGLRAVDFTLARARGASSAFVGSHFLRAAIAELRRIPDTQELRAALERELRDRQREAVGEFKGPWRTIDLTEIANAHIEAHRPLDLSDALLHFAFLDQVVAPEKAKQEALKDLNDHPLGSLFGSQHQDGEGKVVAHHPGGKLGEPTDVAVSAKMQEHARRRRAIVSAGAIQPVRQLMGEKFSITEQDFWPIVDQSPFVPPDHAALFALGFARFFQGDLMSATHLLLPQLEPSLRHVLRNAGEEPSMMQADLTQEDRSLSSMLEHDGAALEAVFGSALLLAVEQVFNLKPPGLRHAMAHGQVSAAECFGDEVAYALWLMFHLTCAPLGEHWATDVRPNLRVEGRSDLVFDVAINHLGGEAAQ